MFSLFGFIDPGYGDYPKIEYVGVSRRDPYEHFDWPVVGYNYKEVIHADVQYVTGDRYDPDYAKDFYKSEYVFH